MPEVLLLLACPVGMGLMMWFMMRGGKAAPTPQPEVRQPEATPQPEVTPQLEAVPPRPGLR